MAEMMVEMTADPKGDLLVDYLVYWKVVYLVGTKVDKMAVSLGC